MVCLGCIDIDFVSVWSGNRGCGLWLGSCGCVLVGLSVFGGWMKGCVSVATLKV